MATPTTVGRSSRFLYTLRKLIFLILSPSRLSVNGHNLWPSFNIISSIHSTNSVRTKLFYATFVCFLVSSTTTHPGHLEYFYMFLLCESYSLLLCRTIKNIICASNVVHLPTTGTAVSCFWWVKVPRTKHKFQLFHFHHRAVDVFSTIYCYHAPVGL